MRWILAKLSGRGVNEISSKVSAPSNIAVIVGVLLTVLEVFVPDLAAILKQYDISGLVVGLVGLVMAIVGYATRELRTS